MSMTASLDQIAPSFTGQLLQPADAGYDEARRVHNGLVDKRPALIARARAWRISPTPSSWRTR
jgi:hypothetical protein